MAGFDLILFEKKPVLGIIRGMDEESLPGVLEAAFSGGLRFLEFTLNTPSAFLLIKKAIEQFPDLCIGAGTVLSAESAQKAVDAGAKFLVAPNLNENVAEFCYKNNLAYFPGVKHSKAHLLVVLVLYLKKIGKLACLPMLITKLLMIPLVLH